MKNKLRNIFIVSAVLILIIILLWVLFFFNGQGQSYWEALLGSLLGTFAGAGIVLIYQVRTEQSRYFREFSNQGQEIMAEKTAWYFKNDKWINVEFRRAVGMAKWDNDPENYLEYQIENFKECNSIDWHGVAYRIDENFCIASKSLLEYATWYQNVMEACHVNLLSSNHVKMMWRVLVDALYPAGQFTQKNSPGMRKWLEQFIFGSVVYENKDKEDFKTEYNLYQGIRKIIENYKPALERLSSMKSKEWGLSNDSSKKT